MVGDNMKKLYSILVLLCMLLPLYVYAETPCNQWASKGSTVCKSKTYQGYKCAWNGNKKGGSRCYKSNNLAEKEKEKITSCSQIKSHETCVSSKIDGHECIWRQNACYGNTMVDDGSGETIIADDQDDRDKQESKNDDSNKELELDKVTLNKVTCDTLFKNNGKYNNTHELLSTTLKFMQYIGVILALVLSTIDFIKVVPTQDKDAIKKASSKAFTRLVIAIIIFFVPIILDFILELVGFNNPTCGLL